MVSSGVCGALGVRAAADSPTETATAKGNGEVATPIWSARRVPELLSRPVAARRLNALLAPLSASVSGTHCLAVRDSSGRALFGDSADTPLVPGSNMKLLTAAAALERLGPQHRLRTTITARSGVVDGVIEGDLHLVGGGDPLIVSESYLRTSRYGPYPHTPLASIADAVVAAGVVRVTGSIVGDEARYDAQRSVPTWPARYLAEGQVGPLSALSVNDARTYPVLEPAGAIARPAPDPAVYAATALGELLRARGVRVDGPPRSGPAPAGATLIATVESLPVAEIVAQMLTFSDNNTAELLVKELDAHQGRQGTTEGGLDVVRAVLASSVSDAGDATLTDGSGLDRGNRVSCDDLVELLVAERPDGALASGLAVAGETGTLRDRFVSSPQKGRARAKTGTLRDVTALSGWVPGADDAPLAFSFILNTDERRVGPADLAIQERLVEAIATYPQQPPLESLAPRPAAGKSVGVNRSGG